MRLEMARRIGLAIVAALREDCEAIALAGSIRREKPDVKDVEVVYIPRLVVAQTSLFGDVAGEVPATQATIKKLVETGVLEWDQKVKRAGPRHQRLIHVASGLVFDFFRAEPDTWGLQLALRTGPRDFNKVVVSHEWQGGGAMPVGMVMRNGKLWRRGKFVPTPTEEVFFAEIGIPRWPPQARSAQRLQAWLKAKRKKGGVL